MKKNNKGFTLVELIVVIAILGVLMAVLVPQYIQYVEKSKVGVDESYMGEVAHAAATEAALKGLEGEIVITFTVSTGAYSITEPTVTPAVDIDADVKAIVPETAFGSKLYKTGTGAIKATVSASGAVSFTKPTKAA